MACELIYTPRHPDVVAGSSLEMVRSRMVLGGGLDPFASARERRRSWTRRREPHPIRVRPRSRWLSGAGSIT